MIHKLPTDSVIAEIHQIRREISDRFHGDINAIADDAAKRLAKSGRVIWQPKDVKSTADEGEAKP